MPGKDLTMRIVLPFLVIGLARAVTQCGNVVCFHNAPCVVGNIDYTGHPTDLNGNPIQQVTQTGVHCECTPGYTGVDCSIPVENCQDGTHVCFNGGTCVSDSSSSVPYCDCSDAVDLADGSKYVGRFCEQKGPPAAETSAFCAAVDVHTFCLNGGTCNPMFPGSSSSPCVCGDAYSGAHCEMLASDNVPDCTLGCQNGGVCRLGEGSDNDGWMMNNPNDQMHCECPEGFVGNLCEISTDACAGIDCLNGGVCQTYTDQKTGAEKGYCQCPTARNDDDIYYAGPYCQYQSTAFCDYLDKPYFCTNNGQCNTNNPMAGCICDPGTDGFYCEYVQEADCDLGCINGACKIGQPPEYTQEFELWLDAGKHHDYQYCECPPGYSGKACEITAGNACDDFACLNGGTCNVVESYGETQYSCDCLSAYVDEIPYDGRFCEFKATSICYEDLATEEIYFCANGGQCQADHMQGCLCPEGFGGFSCEFLQDRDCTLDCKNGGVCTLGSPPGQNYLTAYWYSADTFANYQYCACPEGWSGEFCEAETVDCGDYKCLNGGTCDYNGETLHGRCNCVDASEFNLFYDGLYCQFPSTETCKELPNEVYFCTNGGKCRHNYLDGCDCPEGYGGFYCELLESVDCTLNCGDHGTCRLGAPPGGSHAHAYWYDPAAADNYQYCECDSGWGGQYCEEAGDDCGTFTCLNGGSCLDRFGKALADRCDCINVDDTAPDGSTIYYDGRFCQYASTSTCFEGEFDGDEQVFFCMNDGVCGKNPGEPCVCPDGFSGFSCEFIEGTDCTLDCGANGECRLGTPPGTSVAHAYWFSEDSQDAYQYCECKNGAGGKFCDEEGGEDCGDFVCLNGGSCTDLYGKSMVDRCYCGDAQEKNGDSSIYYDGRFCQYPSTTICFESDVEAYWCANGGTCGENPKIDPCTCPDGYTGHSCEFLTGTDCTLDCNGHGTCRLGSPPKTSHAHEYWFSPYRTWDYQYCECDGGYGGKHCEFAGEDCGDFTCLNGGRCDPSLPTRCDCLGAVSYGEGAILDTFYEGRFCQYESNTVCHEGDTESFFCVNGGKCRDNHLDGCDCPDGFTGFSCEFVEGSDCTLDCQNGGTCKIGVPPGTDYTQAYWYSANAQGDYQYCECISGTDGPLCESHTTDCGDFTCLNKGTCTTDKGKPLDNRCNCIPASDDGVYFDGLYCQLPSTSVCYDGKLDGSDQVLFCMQDGTCQDDPTLGCICPAGTGGFSCEFKDPEDCTLDCKNGKCMLGSPSWIATEETYWFNSERVADYQYCLCDDGFTGTLCDTAGGDKCGDGECYNGGTCVSRTIGGVDVEHCDCRTAGNHLANEYYAGTYCQYRATQLCDIGNNGDLFCVNNGKCGDRSFEGCDCPDKTAGFSCEFVLDDSVTTSTGGTAIGSRHVDSPEDAKCELDCNGHGTCRHGIKNLDELGIAINANQLSYTHENFQHCVCEPGWTGVFCDTEIKQCNDLSGHFCLHGSTCFAENNVEKCDCSKATSKIADAFAGDHCEHVADICVKMDDIGSAESYCANNGKCKKYTDVEGSEHPGCICPKGFIGEKCQFSIGKGGAKGTHESFSGSGGGGSDSGPSGLGITAIILSLLAIVAIGWFAGKKCIRRRFFGKSGESSGLIWASKGGYKDNAETVNFSPNRDGKHEDFMASFASPSRDPMATALAPDTASEDMFSDMSSFAPTSPVGSHHTIDDEPQVFIGPPTDEDGHILHSVDIL